MIKLTDARLAAHQVLQGREICIQTRRSLGYQLVECVNKLIEM